MIQQNVTSHTLVTLSAVDYVKLIEELAQAGMAGGQVYDAVIAKAAELASVHPRTLRIYEEEGLLCPQRRNNLRLYSEADLQRVRIIRFLTRRQGVNLAGVKVILQLEALGKIRVYDLFDGSDVERYVEEGEPEPVSASTEGTRDRP